MARQTIYEPHPVSPERKAELLAQGYRILDARFMPIGEKQSPEPYPVPKVEEPTEVTQPKKRGRSAKVASKAQISDKAGSPSEE